MGHLKSEWDIVAMAKPLKSLIDACSLFSEKDVWQLFLKIYMPAGRLCWKMVSGGIIWKTTSIMLISGTFIADYPYWIPFSEK